MKDEDSDNLAAGVENEELLLSYPTISIEDVQAALDYAAELAQIVFLVFRALWIVSLD